MEGGIEPVLCELQYSGAVAALPGLAAAATVAIVLALPWTLALRGFIVLAIVGLALREHGSLFAVRLLRVGGDGAVSVTHRDGRVREGRLEAGSFVSPWLTIVRWRPTGARFDRTVPITPAMAHRDAFRRLRVRLRHG
jgi:hypothetical protein